MIILNSIECQNMLEHHLIDDEPRAQGGKEG